jgi:hypothetical protein
LAAASPALRAAFEEALMASVRQRLPREAADIPAARRAAERIAEVFGSDGLPGKAAELLNACIAYVEAGKQEKAILHLPVELRRLILEAFESNPRQDGT